ncbi:MAG: hypothetical protein WD557_16415 [Dehalococcoidia bacterium]
MYACICKGVRQSEVRRLVAGRRIDPDLVIDVFNLDDPVNCGRCPREIEAIIRAAGGVPWASRELLQPA